MNTYLLDTDICSYAMKRSHPRVLDKFRSVDVGSTCISVVTEAELLFGIKLSAKPEPYRTVLDAFISNIRVLDWNRAAAEHYADIRANLHRAGKIIVGNDLMIAAHCRSVGAILVTNKDREFRRVQGLKVENWTV